MSRARLPFEMKIAEPCIRSWDEMTGTAGQRHCESCQKQVHNFAAMTRGQIERLVVSTGGNFCARITHNRDGDPIILHHELKQSSSAVLALSATLLLAPAGLAQAPSSSQSRTAQSDTPSVPPLLNTNTAISGVVTDNQGAILVSSTVTLLQKGSVLGTTKTNGAGQFEFAVLPGEYQIQLISTGFAPSSRSVVVNNGRVEVSDMSLTPGADISMQVTALSLDSSTTMGAMVSTISYGPWYKRWGYRLRHPITYTEYLLHKF
jgi:hypothetical protein